MDKKNVVIKQKKKIAKAKCQGCGKDVMIQVPYVGDILCGECMKPTSWILKTE